MSPVDFGTGTPATVSFGSVTTAKISFTADDESCMWNDFPVAIVCCDLDCSSFTPQNPSPVSQIADWTTAILVGFQTPPESKWPLLRVYEWREAILCGYRFTGRMVFDVLSGSGSFAIGNTLGAGSGYSSPPLVTGHFDTGVVNLIGPDCFQVPCGVDEVIWGLNWSNFSPFIACVIGNGYFEGFWTGPFTPSAPFIPCQQYEIVYNPPCTPDAGLVIHLPTDDCGSVTKTYTQIRNDVNALGLGITAATLGGHGSDTVEPDPNSTIYPDCSSLLGSLFGKPMAGATCTGASDN